MICEILDGTSFLTMWALFTVLGLLSQVLFSGSCFWYYYGNPTYEKWIYKSNPKYPQPGIVKFEIKQMLKGLIAGTICPALSLYGVQYKYSQGYCGVGEHGWGHLVYSGLIVWFVSDFLEWLYHNLGHRLDVLWDQHRHHHVFPNPTPFAVIADEWVDQFVRATPMLFFPMIMPMNIDLLFSIFALLFYGYGTYLHSGHESSLVDSHQPFLYTSYEHYAHHAIAIKNKPYHTGFFLKLWDQLTGSLYPGKCFCARCDREAGNRTVEAYNKIEKPDYSVLLSPKFWMTNTDVKEKRAAA